MTPLERTVLFALYALPIKKIELKDLELACSILETILALNDGKLTKTNQCLYLSKEFIVDAVTEKIEVLMPVYSLSSFFVVNLANIVGVYYDQLVSGRCESKLRQELQEFVEKANTRLNSGDDKKEIELTEKDD